MGIKRSSSDSSISCHSVDATAPPGIRPAIEKGIRSRSNIILHAAFLILPMVLFCAVLLGLVYSHQAVQGEPVASNLTLPGDEPEQGFYYVRLNAPFLIFVASWSSSLASALGISIIALWTYPAAERWLTDSTWSDSKALPTPFQLALVLNIVSGGGIGALWNWMTYLIRWEPRRSSQSQLLKSMGLMLVLASLLWLLVFVADTWLHVATETVPFTQLKATSRVPDTGFRLSDNCTKGNNSWTFQDDGAWCSRIADSRDEQEVLDAPRALAVLNNDSNFSVLSAHDDGVNIYLYMDIATQRDVHSLDFATTTIGVSTQCFPRTRACNVTEEDLQSALTSGTDPRTGRSRGTRVQCTSAFEAHVSDDVPFRLEFFEDPELTDPMSLTGVRNPVYFGWYALTNPDWSQPSNPEVVVDTDLGGMFFVLFCTLEAFDIRYDWINGTLLNFRADKSNNSVTNIISIGMRSELDMIGSYLWLAGSYAALQSTPSGLAAVAARRFSETALSLLSQVLLRTPATQAQHRSQILVTKIPTSALWCLVLANFLFVVTGLVLMAMALVVTDEAACQAQAHLSIPGLVADRFGSAFRAKQTGNIEEPDNERQSAYSSTVGIHRLESGGVVFRQTKGDRLLDQETSSDT